MAAILFLLVSWSVLALTAFGLGIAVLRLSSCPLRTPSARLVACPLGYAVIIAFLQIWHLFYPISSGLLLPLAGVSLLSLALLGRDALPRRLPSPVATIGIIAALCFCAWVADRSLGHGGVGDSATYHWNTIIWANTYRIIPGLANLHDRLGYNNSSLLFDAMLNTGIWYQHAGHLANGFMVCLLVLHIVSGAAGLLRKHPSPESYVYAAMLLPTILSFIAVDGDISAPTTDIPAMLFLLLGIAYAVNMLHSENERPLYFVASVVVLVTAVTMKLSTVFTVVALCPLWLWFAWKGLPLGNRPRPLAVVIVASTVLIGAWMARGTILSGYPFFPCPAPSINVKWRVPRQVVEHTRNYLVIETRYPNSDFAAHRLDDWGWVPSNLRHIHNSLWFTTEYQLEAAAILFLIMIAGAKEQRKRMLPQVLAVWAVLLVALFGWFMAAPDTRFGWPLFWGFVLGVVPCLRSIRLSRTLLVLWMIPVVANHYVTFNPWWSTLFLPPAREVGFYDVPSPTSVKIVESRGGVKIVVPKTWKDFYGTWNLAVSPLPSGSWTNEYVGFRGRRVQDGFIDIRQPQ